MILHAEDRLRLVFRVPRRVPSRRFTVRDLDVGRAATPDRPQKPWFCDVISILPVDSCFTGWLAPRWPNFSLNVDPPIASPRIWCPRQMPNTGTFEATSALAFSIA